MIGNGRLPQHRHGAARSGALLIASSWISLIVIVSLYLALKPAAVERSDLIQEDASMMSPFARMTSLRQCVCPDTPLSEIDEPNVFPGPSDNAPDSPKKGQLKSEDVSEECCGPLTPKEMHNVFEITEPNVPTWKEYAPDRNVMPDMVDWDPDSPGRPGTERPPAKELFDGHGGIIGLENTRLTDPWVKTPGSVGPDEYNTYTDGTDQKDYNVFANGYKFPHY